MSEETVLEQLLQNGFASAEEIIVTNHKPLDPTWIFYGPQEAIEILSTPWRNRPEKQFTEFLIRRYLRFKNIEAYAVVTEAWLAQAPSKDWRPENDPAWQGASKAPNREECLIISAAAKTGKIVFRAWKMIRNHHEQVIKLERKPDYSAAVSGWMLNLFKTEAEDELNYSEFWEKL